jgi:hypothetical protein
MLPQRPTSTASTRPRQASSRTTARRILILMEQCQADHAREIESSLVSHGGSCASARTACGAAALMRQAEASGQPFEVLLVSRSYLEMCGHRLGAALALAVKVRPHLAVCPEEADGTPQAWAKALLQERCA